ncbi:MAG: metallophosphoesterase [Algibacter sp.]
MTKEQKDNLFILVKSLSKSEKRQFKLYVGRLGVNEDSKFLTLFNILDKLTNYDEGVILKKGIVKKQQLSNLKAHLYKQILISLRLNPSHQDIRVQIREQLDFATILYHKGLYKQSLKILDKAKTLAIANEEKNVAYEIVDLEKVIESQYITRSLSTRADELSIQAKALSLQNVLASKLSNLSLQLYGLFLKTGYIKNDEDYQIVTKYFNDRLPKYDINKLGFREKLWLYKARLWYSFLTVDFLSCYKYASKWVDLFYKNKNMIILNPVFFLRGNHYLLESLYYLRQYDKFKSSLKKFEDVTQEAWFPLNDNNESLTFLFIYNNKFNLHFIEGSFDEGLPLIDDVLEQLKNYKNRIDEHHVMVFYYKIASMYFGAGENKKCIEFLDKIISNKSLQMREDLLCFSRILNLVAHYEAGLDYNLEVLIKSTYKFLIKMEDLHDVQKEFIKFLRGLGDIYPHEVKNEFKKLHTKLKEFENDPYQSRAFLYLDIISWLESKIQNRPIGLVIRNKFHANRDKK